MIDEYKELPADTPLQTPVTILDLERARLVLDMDLPMADPCPNCGAFNMHVGDWVCLGQCGPCEVADYDRNEKAMRGWLQGQWP